LPKIHFRPGTFEDVQRNAHLLLPERPLFDDTMWRELPSLLKDLIERRRAQVMVVEDSETGRCRLLGGVAFVDPELLDTALADESQSLNNALFRLVAQGKKPFLSHKEIAVHNAARDLRLLDFLGTPDFASAPGPPAPEDALTFNAVHRAHLFAHMGYFYRDMFVEFASPQARQFMLGLGYSLFRSVTLSSGISRDIFRCTPQQSWENPGSAAAQYFRTCQPVIGFSLAEQDVLLLALLDRSDADMAQSLQLEPDALKKRWRSIYRRFEAAEPGKLPLGSAAHVRRLALVNILRGRMEELRPYRASARKGATASV